MSRPNVEAERNYNGSWTVTALVNEGAGDFIKSMTYYGYTRQEAITNFEMVYGNIIVQDIEDEWWEED